VPHTYGAAWFDQEDVSWIADQGFDHIQIDVDEQWWFSEDTLQNARNIATYKTAVDWANRRNLGVVLFFDVHPFGVQPDPMDKSVVEKRAGQWNAITKLFEKNKHGIRFHLGDAYLPAKSDPQTRYLAYVKAIRSVDANRFIYISVPVDTGLTDLADPYLYDGFSALINSINHVDFSKFDKNTAVSFTYFYPEVFLYQNPSQKLKISFPGQVPDFSNAQQDSTYYPDYVNFAKRNSNRKYSEQNIVEDFKKITSMIKKNAGPREIYLRQFGVHTTIEKQSAINYTSAVTKAAKEFGINWCIYDYESGRALRTAEGTPYPAYLGLKLK
jgi:hypothetical protein